MEPWVKLNLSFPGASGRSEANVWHVVHHAQLTCQWRIDALPNNHLFKILHTQSLLQNFENLALGALNERVPVLTVAASFKDHVSDRNEDDKGILAGRRGRWVPRKVAQPD